MITKTNAIDNLIGSNTVSYSTDADGNITMWVGDITQPTEAEIQTKLDELQADYDAKEYARSRKDEYPDIGDQLDDLFHAGAFSTEMTAAIQAVKDKYPKS